MSIWRCETTKKHRPQLWTPQPLPRGTLWSTVEASCASPMYIRKCYTIPSCNTYLGGGNSNIFYFHPENWGRFTIWRAYFSDGLKPPTRYIYRDYFIQAMKLQDPNGLFNQSGGDLTIAPGFLPNRATCKGAIELLSRQPKAAYLEHPGTSKFLPLQEKLLFGATNVFFRSRMFFHFLVIFMIFHFFSTLTSAQWKPPVQVLTAKCPSSRFYNINESLEFSHLGYQINRIEWTLRSLNNFNSFRKSKPFSFHFSSSLHHSHHSGSRSTTCAPPQKGGVGTGWRGFGVGTWKIWFDSFFESPFRLWSTHLIPLLDLFW